MLKYDTGVHSAANICKYKEDIMFICRYLNVPGKAVIDVFKAIKADKRCFETFCFVTPIIAYDHMRHSPHHHADIINSWNCSC